MITLTNKQRKKIFAEYMREASNNRTPIFLLKNELREVITHIDDYISNIAINDNIKDEDSANLFIDTIKLSIDEALPTKYSIAIENEEKIKITTSIVKERVPPIIVEPPKYEEVVYLRDLASGEIIDAKTLEGVK